MSYENVETLSVDLANAAPRDESGKLEAGAIALFGGGLGVVGFQEFMIRPSVLGATEIALGVGGLAISKKLHLERDDTDTNNQQSKILSIREKAFVYLASYGLFATSATAIAENVDNCSFNAPRAAIATMIPIGMYKFGMRLMDKHKKSSITN